MPGSVGQYTIGWPEVELSYLAGFFDADGSVGIYQLARRSDRVTREYVLSVSAAGLHEGSIRRLAAAFGGSVRLKPTPAKHPTHQPIWTWNSSGAAARKALAALLPFLVVKREQAELALQFPVGRKWRQIDASTEAERIDIAARIKALKLEAA